MSGNSVIRPGRRHSTTVSTSEAVLEYAKKSGMKVPDKIAAAIQLHSQHQSYGADEDSQFHLSFASTISKIHLWAYNGKVDQIKLAIAKYPELLKHKFLFTDKELLTPEEQQDDSFIPPAQLPTTVRAAVQAAVACNGRLDKLPIDQRWLMAYSFSNSTLLHYAVVGNQKEVLELLLAKGADTTITNSHKKTAEYYAATSDIRDTLWNAPKFRANEASNSKMNAAPVNISSISITNTNLSGNNGSNAISRDVLSPTSSKNGPRRNSILDLKKKNLDMISNQTKILMVNINSRSSINHKADDEKSVVSALSTSTITTKSSIRRLSRVLGAQKLRAVQEKTQQENRKSISAMLFNNDNSSSVKDGKPFRTVDGSVAYTKPIDDTISVSVAENSSVRTMRMKRLSIAEGSNTIVSKTYEVSGEQHTISEVSPEAEEKSLLKLATANEKPPVGPSALKKVQPPPTTLNKANPMNKELTESMM